MTTQMDQAIMEKVRQLPAERLTEVEDFVEFLVAKVRKRAVLERLLAIAPAPESAGVEQMSEEEIAAEVKAARDERRAR